MYKRQIQDNASESQNASKLSTISFARIIPLATNGVIIGPSVLDSENFAMMPGSRKASAVRKVSAPRKRRKLMKKGKKKRRKKRKRKRKKKQKGKTLPTLIQVLEAIHQQKMVKQITNQSTNLLFAQSLASIKPPVLA